MLFAVISGMEITDNKILLDYSELCLKYNTVKPSCGGRCGEAICIPPKKQKQTLSERIAKDVMRQAVRKKRRRRPPVTSAGIPCPSRIRDQQRVRGLARGESGVVEKVSLRSLSYFVSVLGD